MLQAQEQKRGEIAPAGNLSFPVIHKILLNKIELNCIKFGSAGNYFHFISFRQGRIQITTRTRVSDKNCSLHNHL